MKDNRYALVIMDSSGRSTRRVALSYRRAQALLGGCTLALLVLIGMVVHGTLRVDDAREAEKLARTNEELRGALAEAQARLPDSRAQAFRTMLSSLQVRSKSVLGVDSVLLGIGPVEEGDLDSSEDATGESSVSSIRSTVDLDLHLDALDIHATSVRHTLGGIDEYFRDAERLLQNTPSLRPAQTPWFTSRYGKRKDPISAQWVMHKGVDIGGYIGMKVVSPADGVVIWTGRRGGYGLTVVLDHGYGLQTHFAHLNKYHVKRGDRVRRGDVIAEMGNTGKSTGPHLHYEVRRDGRPMNPVNFILD